LESREKEIRSSANYVGTVPFAQCAVTAVPLATGRPYRMTDGPVARHVIFTALHGMQTRSSDENSVCLSVCQSHAWIVTKR